MKNIDISTAHNISIHYTVASIEERIYAWMIDMALIIGYMLLAGLITSGNKDLFYIFIFPFIAFYHLGFEIMNNGQSIGKKILKIKVVTLNGRSATGQDYFLRWIFRLLEITGTIGILAIVYVTTTEKNQRIGDILAQTTVIKLKSDRFYDLDALVNRQDLSASITYPKVAMYHDEDILLVKNTIKRLKQFPSEVNSKFAQTLVEKIYDDLSISPTNDSNIQFLETILSDYISATR